MHFATLKENMLNQIDSILRANFEIDSQYRVNLTQIFSNYSESRVEV